jgi:ribosomal protein S18 acetylase RimI-like enzyme
MIPEIKVVKAEPEDWEEAMELAWRTFLKFEAPGYSEEGILNFLNLISGEKLYRMYLNGSVKLFVAKKDGKIVGMGALRSLNHISLLFVDKAYHRQGIGRELVRALQREAFKSTQSCRITVNSAPYAIGFYETLGFIKTQELAKADGIEFLPMTMAAQI